jgi:hypothetical protein
MLPEEAAVGVEGLDGEHAAAAVAEDEEPPRGDAARGREPWPPAAQERAIAVPPDLDAPRLCLSAGRADDEGLVAADLRGELVGDALRIKQVQENKISQSHGRAGAARAGGSDERWARTRVSEVKGSSTLGCAANGAIGDSGGHRPTVSGEKR